MHAIGRRFESVHLHNRLAAGALVLALLCLFVPSAPAVIASNHSIAAQEAYVRFVASLQGKSYSEAYDLLDKLSRSYLERSLDSISELKKFNESYPAAFPVAPDSDLGLLFTAKDGREVFALMVGRYFPSVDAVQKSEYDPLLLEALTSDQYVLTNAKQQKFLLVREDGTWKVCMADRFMQFYEEMRELEENICYK